MKPKVYLSIALVFFLGMLCGGALVVQIVKSKVQSLAKSSTEEVSQIVLKQLERDLDLSEEQRGTISEILTEAVKEVDPMRTEMRSRALQIIQKYQKRIGEELTAEQRQEFDGMVDEIKKTSNLKALEQNAP